MRNRPSSLLLLAVMALALGACRGLAPASGHGPDAPRLKTIHVRTSHCGHYPSTPGDSPTAQLEARPEAAD